jgi:predicted TIM-barrel enzyme
MGAQRVAPSVLRTGDIVLPPIASAPDLPLELSGLMPNRDHNGDLMREIERLPHCPAGQRPVIGILAADPFLRIDQLADRLGHKGYRDLVNLPSVSQYGAAFRTLLNDLNVGAAREMRVLAELASLGFAVSVAIAHNDDIAPALALAPACLFVVPSFDLWNDGKLDSSSLLALCSEAAERRRLASPESQIVLFAGRASISPAQMRAAGADGVLLD